MSIPPKFRRKIFVGAAGLCAVGDHGHVHGSCHSTPFKVVFVYTTKDIRTHGCVYSSETGIWNIISTSTPCQLFVVCFAGTLIAKALYWPLFMPCKGILQFNLEEQSLAVIKGPPLTNGFYKSSFRIIQAEDGIVGLAILSYPRFQMCKRDINWHGVAIWVLQKTIEIHSILGLPPQIEGGTRVRQTKVGYSEDTDVVFIFVGSSLYMVQLKSMQSKRLYGTSHFPCYYPLTRFYAPGNCSSMANIVGVT
ncbi:LOW QUALITY PROTEIN: hypothetical protein CFC21_039656 [Triticum aestivum]|uniref:Uncharacterized protein n=2 Tax=Triticum aestivum TaxID=4565 RepID=A0A3B6FH39_WHEAT|nr:LOW QUALITY PROTEIN: hypothetical protein CFC21_039656 [Triticum aestivum]